MEKASLYMQSLLESLDNFGLPGVLSGVFRQLTRIVIVGPTLGYLRPDELDDDVHRLNSLEIIGEMGADTE